MGKSAKATRMKRPGLEPAKVMKKVDRADKRKQLKKLKQAAQKKEELRLLRQRKVATAD